MSSDIAWMTRNARNAALMSTARTLAEDSAATSTERAKVASISKSPGRRRRTDLSRCTAISPPTLFCNRRANGVGTAGPGLGPDIYQVPSRRTPYLGAGDARSKSARRTRGVLAKLKAARHRFLAGELGAYMMLLDPPTFAAKPPEKRDLGSCHPQETPQGTHSVAGRSSRGRHDCTLGPQRPSMCRLSITSSPTRASWCRIRRPSPGRTAGLRRGDDNTCMACRTGRTPCPFVGISNYFLEISQETLSSHRALHQYAAPIQRVPPSAHQIEL